MSDYYLGEIRIMTTSWAPKDWVPCDGRLLPLQMNAALFSLIGTIYGGDGRSNFAVPNLNGRFLVGQGRAASGTDYPVGTTTTTPEAATLTNAAIWPSHNHTATLAPSATKPVLTVPATSAAGTQSTPGGNILAKGVVGAAATSSYATVPPPSSVLGGVTVSGQYSGGAVAVAPAGSAAPFTVAPPYQTINYMICIKGLFPSRP